MADALYQVLTFGAAGDAAGEQLFGWSAPEDGFTWIDARSAGLRLRNPRSAFGFFLEVFGWPHRGPALPGQSVRVSVNGAPVGQGFMTTRSHLAWHVPPQTHGDFVFVQFDLPDACRAGASGDPRILGIAMQTVRVLVAGEPVRTDRRRLAAWPIAPDAGAAIELAERMTGLPVRELSLSVESAGANCELGFFQRHCGAEPLSLLRFAGVTLASLVAGLDDSFARLGEASAIDPVPEETTLDDWVIYERRYGLRYHTWVKLAEATGEAMVAREAKRLAFLRDKLLADIAEGAKIFVHQECRRIELAEILPLHLALRRIGPAQLLWICPADADHPPGFVEEVYPGLLRGFFSRFMDAASGDLSMPDWLGVVAAAHMLCAAPPASSDPHDR